MDIASGFVYRNDGDMRAHEFFLYSLVRGIKPKRILEIGVRTGISTFAISQAVKDAGLEYTYHHLCDIDPSFTTLPFPTETIHHIMSSDELAVAWKQQIKMNIDLLLIDGCHEYTQVFKDFINFLPHMNIGGFVLFHDTNPSEQDKHPGACWDAYRILGDLRKMRDVIEYITLPYSYGLTVVKVTGPINIAGEIK
jgi:predicted O-methyltransferase YrrM